MKNLDWFNLRWLGSQYFSFVLLDYIKAVDIKHLVRIDSNQDASCVSLKKERNVIKIQFEWN